jgi:hypothetical protein
MLNYAINAMARSPRQRKSADVAVAVVDLVDLFMRDGRAARKFFVQAQRFYEYSFPPEEREPIKVARRYISDSIKAIRAGKKVRFHYLVAVAGGQSRGMTTFNLLPVRDFGLVVFMGYLVTQMNYKGIGIGRALVDGVEAVAGRHAATGAAFGEIEQPGVYKRNEMRDVIRPNFHTKYTGMGAVVIERKNGKARVVPYRQPGIITGKRVPAPVPLLPCMTPIERGQFRRIDTALVGNTITRGGRLNARADIPEISAGTIRAVLSAVLNDGYGRLPEIYGKGQIKSIVAGIERSLQGARCGYLVPIGDCRLLPPV